MINDLWYKNAVVYCLSVATFMDANGDGDGPFGYSHVNAAQQRREPNSMLKVNVLADDHSQPRALNAQSTRVRRRS